jgi:porin
VFLPLSCIKDVVNQGRNGISAEKGETGDRIVRRIEVFSVVCMFSLLSVVPYAAHEHNWNADTLTDGFFGLNDALEDSGIEVGFCLTSIYQRNTKGGLSTNNRKGEFSGSYDLELTFDMERLLGMPGSFYMHGEGGWTDSEGIDGTSVGSVFGVNADAIGNRSLDIVELFYGVPLGEQFTLAVGKIDFTGFFDASAYANDETAQFLNGSLVNNPAIPFPDYSLGVILTYNLSDDWYLMAGAADAQADGRETGFNTAFHDEDYFFYIAETGVTGQLDSENGSLEGTYRVGLWYDPQPKAHSDSSKEYRDDLGFYISCDQKLINESDDPEDTQGLGGFFRYGYAPSKTNDISCFYSFGLQYQGLFKGRDDDVLGLGYAHGSFSDQVTQWMAISPSVQYVANPGGNSSVSDAVVVGVRAQIAF